MKENQMLIIIDNGDIFIGNLEQFKNCFFSNATKESIQDWCDEEKFKVEFKEN